jgi:cytoskeleton protein RodZ
MLEEGRFPAVADPAYLTHFLRRYALWLGLDAETMARDFLDETEPETAARRSGRMPPETPDRRPPISRPLSLRRVVYAAVLLAALAGVFALARFEQQRQMAATETASVPSRALRPAPVVGSPPSRQGADDVRDDPDESSVAEVSGRAPPHVTAAAPAPLTASPPEPAADLGHTKRGVEPNRAPPGADAPVPVAPPAEAVTRGEDASGEKLSPKAPAEEAPAEKQERARALPQNPPASAGDPRNEAETAPAAESPPGEPNGIGPEPPFELRLTARARQVWIWLSVDGGPRQTVSLARGQSAVFRAEHGYVLSVDDAGGIDATLNGDPLPSLGESAQARRNLVIPSGELTPLGEAGDPRSGEAFGTG